MNFNRRDINVHTCKYHLTRMAAEKIRLSIIGTSGARDAAKLSVTSFDQMMYDAESVARRCQGDKGQCGA